MGRTFVSAAIFLSLVAFGVNPGLSQDSTSIDLTGFSLEELMDVKVVSISRKAESIQGAAAAVFVISEDDIRRSGAHSIAEVLRLAPGLNVARISASTWAVTARGFNSRYANKLQVLEDGRSIYSPMFSGVYWEESFVMLEDIQRIEIIRGPGATMWGANAVNGVINIITKKQERDDHSSFVAAMFGTEEIFRGAGRIGGNVGAAGVWRLSTQFKKHHSTQIETGDDSYDAWDEFMVRSRWDHQLGERDNLTLSGHFFQSNLEGEYFDISSEPPYSRTLSQISGFRTASFQSIFAREMSQTSNLKLGLYFTHFDRDEIQLKETHNIVDLDFQHHFYAGRNHSIVWGGTGRFYHDNLRGTPGINFNPDSIDGYVFSAFIQDDWCLVPDRLNLVLGGKWEHREDTGIQKQPSIRLAWTPSLKTTWWGSVARAVRVPSRINRGIQMDLTMLPPDTMYPGSPTTSITLLGSRSMRPEELVAFETGWRFKPHGKLSLDLALFINQYDQLRVLEMGSLQPHPLYGPSVMMLPAELGNGPGGRTQGGELAANWKPAKHCRFQLAYSYWDFKGAEVDPGEENGMEGLATPKHQVSLRGLFNPVRNWEGDVWFRFTDDLMADPGELGAWNELDLRVSWSPVPRLQMVLGGRNLLHEKHQEFVTPNATPIPAYIQRSGYLELQWNF